MKCKKCRRQVNHINSLNVNDKRLCVKCAYRSFPNKSPARIQLAKRYGFKEG